MDDQVFVLTLMMFDSLLKQLINFGCNFHFQPSIVPKRPRYEEEERERVKAKGSSNLPPKKHKRIDMVPGILQVPLMEARKQDSSPDFPKGVPRLLGKESDGDKLNKIIKARKAAKESSQRNKNDLAIQQLLDQDTPSEV